MGAIDQVFLVMQQRALMDTHNFYFAAAIFNNTCLCPNVVMPYNKNMAIPYFSFTVNVITYIVVANSVMTAVQS